MVYYIYMSFITLYSSLFIRGLTNATIKRFKRIPQQMEFKS